MALLQVWSPFREIERFRREFDDMLERMLGDVEGRKLDFVSLRVPAVESFVEDGKFMMRFDLPGIDPADVEVKVVGNVLTVSGKREEKREKKGRDFLCREVRYGSFERSIELPQGIEAEDIKATYKHGVLELAAPLPKELVKRTVEIETAGGEGKQVEAKKGGAKEAKHAA